MRATALPLIAALATAAALCTACSAGPRSDAGKNSSAEAPADHAATVRAAVKATRATSVDTRQKIETSDGEGQTYVLDVTGRFDLADDRGTLRVRMPKKPGKNTLQEVFANGQVYVSDLPDVDEGVWATMPRHNAVSHAVLRAPVNDPEYLLQQIAAMRMVTEEGKETIEGVRTTRYRGMLDHAALTRRMSPDLRDEMDRTRDTLGAEVVVFAEAWIDDKGHLVRTRTDLNLGGPRTTVTLNLSHHGSPVEVTVPMPYAQVLELAGPFLG
ncbi:LppX_LprAFG lipoprotein [Streptomyces sp. NBC_00006]|uniref:LppX_LprAFG lipoprotein n=1 Tax=unclassified Streptomyces TaxID=2593676 RepID=UPI00224CB0F9|nr:MULTISPECIES: LppX_LprAFG lipoprotein [unclassified Streptomyces]MCX5532128.1 LppX_LprAFG lipoprotein [Streptomyces sp. NBC_00006]